VSSAYGFVGAAATVVGAAYYVAWVLRALPAPLAPPDGGGGAGGGASARYWALAAPAALLLVVCSYALLYACLSLAAAPRVDAYDTLSDAHARRVAARELPGARGADERATPEFGDLPVALVNRLQRRALREGGRA